MKMECERCGHQIEFQDDEERDRLIYAHNSTVHFPGFAKMLEGLAAKLHQPFDPMEHAPSRKKGGK